MLEPIFVYIKLGKLWANVEDGIQDMLLWIASDVKTKLIAEAQKQFLGCVDQNIAGAMMRIDFDPAILTQ